MALSTVPQSVGSGAQAPTVQPEQPRGLTVRERFNNLSARQQDEILDKHRHWNVEHVDWWDGVYDCFKADMDDIGVEVDKMYFSGFWSQGDGACFEGSVNDWPKFLASLGYTCPALIALADRSWHMRVEHRGHYYHENCTRFSVELPLPAHDEDQNFIDNYLFHIEEDSVQMAAAMALLNTYSSSSLMTAFTDAFKDHMRTLYNQLEAEYDRLTSDEAILDSLEINDQLEDAIISITEEEEYA
jgi:hypothetical protein